MPESAGPRSRVGECIRHTLAHHALDLLVQARLLNPVIHGAGNGVLPGREVNDSFRKVLFLDVGLLQALLATPQGSPQAVWEQMAPEVRGRLAEQAVGQEVAAPRDPWAGPLLYYWQRGGGRAGGIDCLLQIEGRVLPLETKSGATGAVKSPHHFMYDKRLDLTVRCDANPPATLLVDLRTTAGDPVRFNLLCLPPHLLWRLRRRIPDVA